VLKLDSVLNPWKNGKVMNKNDKFSVQIKSTIEHKALKTDDYGIHYLVSGKEVGTINSNDLSTS